MNITQQVAASIGTALFSVLLTNGFNGSPEASALRDAAQSGASSRRAMALAKAFRTCRTPSPTSFTVAAALVALCLVPAWFLPRSKPRPRRSTPAAMVH